MIAAKWLYNLAFAPSPSKEWYEQEYQKLLDKINAIGDDEVTNDNQHVEESYMPDAVFFRHKGKKCHTFCGN